MDNTARSRPFRRIFFLYLLLGLSSLLFFFSFCMNPSKKEQWNNEKKQEWVDVRSIKIVTPKGFTSFTTIKNDLYQEVLEKAYIGVSSLDDLMVSYQYIDFKNLQNKAILLQFNLSAHKMALNIRFIERLLKKIRATPTTQVSISLYTQKGTLVSKNPITFQLKDFLGDHTTPKYLFTKDFVEMKKLYENQLLVLYFTYEGTDQTQYFISFPIILQDENRTTRKLMFRKKELF